MRLVMPRHTAREPMLHLCAKSPGPRNGEQCIYLLLINVRTDAMRFISFAFTLCVS